MYVLEDVTCCKQDFEDMKSCFPECEFVSFLDFIIGVGGLGVSLKYKECLLYQDLYVCGGGRCWGISLRHE